MRLIAASLCTLACSVLFSARARAEGEAARPVAPQPAPATVVVDACRPPCRLGASFTLAGWLSRMDGELTVRGQTAEVDQDFDDVFDLLENHLDGILQGQVRVTYGRWAVQLASSWLRLEADRALLRPAGGTAEVSSEIWQGQLDVWYRVGETALGCEPCSPCVLYDVYAGVRWMDVENELRTPAAVREQGKSWVDPVIGGRVAYDFHRRWIVDLQADVGGFGVASDFTWRVRVGGEWWFSRHAALKAGWMWLGTDYESGSGADAFAWDIVQDGPYFGLTVAF
jgi:hypothetical protein